MMDIAKNNVNFDKLSELVPRFKSSSNQAVRQMMQLLNKESSISFSIIVPDEDKEI